jgi:hypothetical protein
MPFPELATVKTTKGEQIAVPELNQHQRNWILDIGVRDHDLASPNKKDALQVYEEIMLDAFEAKAFQHTPQPQDRDEESRLPGLAVAWKKQHNQWARKNTGSGDDSDTSDQEEDEGGHVALLRGYATQAACSVAYFQISQRCLYAAYCWLIPYIRGLYCIRWR